MQPPPLPASIARSAARGSAVFGMSGAIMGAVLGLILALLLLTTIWFLLTFADQKTAMHDWIVDPSILIPFFVAFGLLGAITGGILAALLGGLGGAVSAMFRRGRGA